MARVKPDGSIGPRHLEGTGSKVLTRILASQADGCNRISVKTLTIRPDGSLPRKAGRGERVYYILRGPITFVDGDGFPQSLATGDTVFIGPDERFHFRNEGREDVMLLLAAEPK